MNQSWLADFESPSVPGLSRRRRVRTYMRPVALSHYEGMGSVSSFFKRVGDVISLPFRAIRKAVVSVVSGGGSSGGSSASPVVYAPVVEVPVAAPAASIPVSAMPQIGPSIAMPAVPIALTPYAVSQAAASSAPATQATADRGAEAPGSAVVELREELGTERQVSGGQTYTLDTYQRINAKRPGYLYVPGMLMMDGSIAFKPDYDGTITRRVVIVNEVALVEMAA